MTNATTNVARVAAAVAGFGLVAMSFAPLAGAQTTTTTTTTTTASVTFTRDLTIGSTGADVTALQTWLIAKGYSIPAGPTGYFGTQTRAAVAAYQAANNITPAAGYFGPITRASVMANGGTTTTTEGCQPGYEFSPTTGERCETTTDNDGDNDSDNDGELNGDEASLEDFNLLSEDAVGSEGESEVEVATAEFDVEDGDARVERAELTLHAASSTLNEDPWDYIDNVSVWADGEKLGDVDTDDRDAWDEESRDNDAFSGGSDDQYTVTINDLDYVVDEGDTADLTFAFDINDSIDSDDLQQSFEVAVLDDGIRAVDALGIQQYTGSDSESVDFDFDEEENGELSLSENDDNPENGVLVADEDDTSDEMTVLVGDIENDGDADTLITDLTFDVSSTSITADLSDVVRRATLEIDGDEFRGDVNDDDTIDFEDIDTTVDADDEVTFTLSIELAPTSVTGFDAGDTLTFDLNSDGVEAEGVDSGDEVEAGDITGAVNGNEFTVATTDVTVSPSTADSDTNDDNSTATFEVVFEVTAGDDDIFIPMTASEDDEAGAANAGAVYMLSKGGTDVATTTGVSDILSSTADDDGSFYTVDAGSTETFTLSVSVNNTAGSGFFEVELDQVHYNDTANLTGLTTYTVGDDADFTAGPENVEL